MIEIDLLPLELRKREKQTFARFFKKRVIFSILGWLVCLHLLLYLTTFINSRRLKLMEKNWQALAAKKAEIDRIKQQLAKIKEKIDLIEGVMDMRVLWSEKLNRISDLLVSGVWLSELTVERQKLQIKDKAAGWQISLIIRGSAASRTKDEPALIGRFMQKLKDDTYFSADFTGIELGPIKKRLIKQTEVMDFVLSCQFRQDRAEALLK